MTQMSEDQDLIQNELPEDEPDIDPDNPDGELPDEQETPEATGSQDEPEESLNLTIAGFEDDGEGEDETRPKKGDPDWVNRLRRDSRELKRLKRSIERGQVAEPDSDDVGPEPTLANPTGNPADAYDEDAFRAAHREWVKKSIAVEERKKEKEKAAHAAERAFQERVASYDAQKRALPVDDFEDAEETVQSTLNHIQLGILVKNAPEAAKIVYALGKNEKALQHLASIKDADTYAFELGKMMANMKQAPAKKAIPAPERTVKGGSRGFQAATSNNLDTLRKKAESSGDWTEYFAAKRKA